MTDPAKVPLGRYQHYKNRQYELIGIATHSETEELMAVYRPLYGDRALWVRPLVMFLETIEINGEEIPRFNYIGPE